MISTSCKRCTNGLTPNSPITARRPCWARRYEEAVKLLQIRRSLAFNPSSSSSPNHHTNILAAVAAIVLLVAVVLPAEYGVDPTDIGRVLRMTEMGEIKQQLAAEAAADAAAVPASPAQADGAVGIATAGAAQPSTPAPAPAPVAAAAPKIDWRDEVPAP